MKNHEKTNKEVLQAQALLLKGDEGKDFAIQGKTSQERRESLARIINAQKRSYQLC
ncbi:TPA: hypothetical protein MFA42_005108 [Klebsiella pneumoniae]|jgi:hypothetical protein|uniref:Uncharacterized protein n=1 Tax=Klebsiella quasipneumoniae subsp. quasipneumoniae TaxID=1667327 RepID=A0AAN1Y2A2_9ENTR|nr:MULTISPECIES: hypothetical protein [Klebsiella/Raoultella group]MCS6057595.1 hypothetical protein [Klebsiella variicola subsp. variicola]HDX9079191.1 hypothetical protein [Klebsiella oxytoca]EIV7983391.1 hypothetical protein [Klebsiella pneumoniae]EIX9475049.1 hypothetical protein [Klebsiella pneumoniae]EIX9579941.1 hypothetical protein [Klebsiella pneumoniae]